jgi:hypothetical protein
MIIKFIDTKAEHQVEIGRGTQGRGLIRNDVVNGRYVAKRGILCEGVEDITQYTLDEEGNKVEVTEMKPDKSWFVSDIKLWLDAQEIPYTSKMLKPDLLELA